MVYVGSDPDAPAFGADEPAKFAATTKAARAAPTSIFFIRTTVDTPLFRVLKRCNISGTPITNNYVLPTAGSTPPAPRTAERLTE